MDKIILRCLSNRHQFHLTCSQQGMVLFVSLAILLILTILGLASVQTTTMQERMVLNSQDTNIAFLAAESGLVDAEALIEMYDSTVDFYAFDANASGLYLDTSFDVPSNWSSVDWDDVDGNYKTAVTHLAGTAAQPKYIIEHVKTVAADQNQMSLENIGQSIGVSSRQIFRITVYGTGGTSDAHVMIQSTYSKQF